MNKKGSIQDLPFVIVFIFVLALTLVIGRGIYTNVVQEGLNESFSNTPEITGSIERGSVGFNMIDWLFALIVIGLYIFLGISAFLLDSHPALFVVALILFIALFFMAPIFSNAYNSFVAGADFLSSSENELTVAPHIMDNLPMYIIFAFIVVAISLYARRRFGSGVE